MPKISKISAKFTKNLYESDAWSSGQYVIGVDEVGRGCSAGPLVTAAAILPQNARYHLLKDSKKLSQKELVLAYNWIIKHCWYSIGIANHRTIDRHNIYKTTQKTMKRAITQLLSTSSLQPKSIVIDAMPLQPETFYPDIYYFTQGESKSTSIAAASIIAKVTRDRIMETLSNTFVPYSLQRHKGYHTELHQQALAHYGVSLIHRKTFIHEPKHDDSKQQSTLFC